MKFVDQASIYISSGHGGPGCVSFRREKYIPKGGPDGGDGGRGGDVIIEASSQKETLLRFHLNQHFNAGNGLPGEGKRKSGRSGQDMRIMVPAGTLVYDYETGDLLADLKHFGDVYIAAKGGRGGQGNSNFATGSNRSPRYAQPGEPGMSTRVRLELRLLADAGLLGYPNAGKSSLISKISAARPKIADYPFTTLVPNLGVVGVDEMHSFVVADLPGLIDGAAEGAGLGHRFLKHLSRCAVMVHIIDPARVLAGEYPSETINKINMELKAFDSNLAEKKQILALSKMDLPEGSEALELLLKEKLKIYPFSSFTGEGLAELKWAIWDVVKQSPSYNEVETWGKENHEIN